MSEANTSDIAAAIQEKERLENSGRLHWFHWAIIIASLVLTLSAWYFTKTQHENQIRERFEREAQRTVDLVQERMQNYEDLLSNAAAAVHSKYVHLDHASWKEYSDALDFERKYPGINGIGVIDQVSRSDLQAYLQAQREQRPNFDIFPKHSADELLPIVFVEPLEANAAAVGLDMAHEVNRYTGVKNARDSGKPQITGPIILVQDSEQTPGFLFFVPLYSDASASGLRLERQAFTGLVYAPFIVRKLMRGTLESTKRQVGISITDDGIALFDENEESMADFDPNPQFKTRKEIEIYGRTWSFDIWSNMAFNRSAQNNKPALILIGGLSIDALLLALFTLLARANRRAIQFANRMAAAQEADATRFKNIFTHALDGLITLDENFNIQSLNTASEKIFDYSGSELIGKDVQVILPDLLSDNDSSNSEHREITGLRKNGAVIDVEISVSTYKIEDDNVHSAIIRNITDRKLSEKWLKETLDDLIMSNKELEKFAYVASHDLKSPLRGIDNLSKWLEEDLDDVLDAENRSRFQSLRGRVTRMEDLLNALLEYSRAGRILDTSEKTSADLIISDIWNLLDVPEGFALELGDNLRDLEVNRMPLEQVFHNLISNALKHHDKLSGKITVNVNDTDDFYKFTVADDGPGVSPEYHEKIFEMFQTLRPRDEVEGSGMGLALVRKIIYNYGGRIDIQSKVGAGCIFTFLWPKVPHKTLRARKFSEKDRRAN